MASLERCFDLISEKGGRMKPLRDQIADRLINAELMVIDSQKTRLELADIILEILFKDIATKGDRIPETREEKINRLLESHNYLYRSMIKMGVFYKCHDELFKKIKTELDKTYELGSGEP